MTDAPLTPREADDAEAAEYVLGVQDLAERSATEARIKRDPEFAALVTAWETRLEGLNDGFDPVPAPDLLPAIEARLFPRAAKA
ncbi:MAG: anti-sigma factor, partial [Rhodobacterales bacterium]